MDINAAGKLAVKLMHEHGIAVSAGGRFLFKWSSATRSFGMCQYPQFSFTHGYIKLSRRLVALNDEATVRNTILHEIAHALVPANVHHGPRWVAMARAIGCDGKRTYDATTVAMPPRRWRGTCPVCGRVIERHRRRDRLACGVCHPRHGLAALFEWSQQ